MSISTILRVGKEFLRSEFKWNETKEGDELDMRKDEILAHLE